MKPLQSPAMTVQDAERVRAEAHMQVALHDISYVTALSAWRLAPTDLTARERDRALANLRFANHVAFFADLDYRNASL